jgi:quercetin dioxygenase-like cupin family protein
MEIKRAGSQPSTKGPSDWFTGTVRIDPLFQAPDPAFGRGASVTFEPGARTAWHTHPLGQTLIVMAGCGWVQRWNLNYAQIDLCGCVASFSCHGVCLSSRAMVPGGVLPMM